MKIAHYATATARYLLGLIFTVFGLNFFLHFLPQPPMSGPPMDFAMALMQSGYVMQTVKVVEVAAGLLLLFNRYVPLALTLLAPIVVGVVGFHASLAPATGGGAYLALALELFLAYAYRAAYAPLFVAQSTPSLRGSEAPRVHASDLQHSVT
jgi:putative oxidoreductase